MAKRKITSEHERIAQLESAVPDLQKRLQLQVLRTASLEAAIDELPARTPAGSCQ